MALSINRATLVGNAGKDAEIRYTGAGAAVATFSVATTENWTDKASGQKKERTEWHNIVAWNWLAEYCGENVKKGKKVLVEGRIQTRSYDDKEGVKKYVTEIEAATVMAMERGGQGNAPPPPGSNYRSENTSRASSSQSSSGQSNSGPAPVPDYEPQQSGPVDDLPF
jgi:single-strand DNA-binding protein